MLCELRSDRSSPNGEQLSQRSQTKAKDDFVILHLRNKRIKKESLKMIEILVSRNSVPTLLQTAL